ncbi:MAG: hypothetical protein WDW36_008150 [Sanguina aurantia]
MDPGGLGGDSGMFDEDEECSTSTIPAAYMKVVKQLVAAAVTESTAGLLATCDKRMDAALTALALEHAEQTERLTQELHALRKQLATSKATSQAPPTTPSHISALPAPPASQPVTRTAAQRLLSPSSTSSPPSGAPAPLPPPPASLAPAPAPLAPPPTKPQLYLCLPAASPDNAATEQVQALFSICTRIECKVERLVSNTRTDSTAEEPSQEAVQAMAVLGLVRAVTPPRAGRAPAAPAREPDTRQRFLITIGTESEQAVRLKLGTLRSMGIIVHDNLSPEQQASKRAQSGFAKALYNAGTPVQWNFDELSKKVQGRWVVVPVSAQ